MMSRFKSKPKSSHYQVAVRILRYVKGTMRHEILFLSRVSYADELICYSDSDWCGDEVDISITTIYMFMYLGALISLCSKKQPMVILSTYEAEYIAGAL